MPVSIDEVTAEITPPTPSATRNGGQSAPAATPEARRQRQEEMQALIRQRAERLRAD